MPSPQDAEAHAWLNASPDHFYVRYEFPSARNASWDDCALLTASGVQFCSKCLDEQEAYLNGFSGLRALDIFAGAGGLSLAMQDAGSVKVTHAIEILPSACQTIKYVAHYTAWLCCSPLMTGQTLPKQLSIISAQMLYLC
jgi:DNA (cytosine-5)-methyltransferase 1